MYQFTEMQSAYEAGNYREHYAMAVGGRKVVTIRGHKCIKFTYPEKIEYQDANGATYDTVDKKWIG